MLQYILQNREYDLCVTRKVLLNNVKTFVS